MADNSATCGCRLESHDHNLKVLFFFSFRVFKKASPNGKVSVHLQPEPPEPWLDSDWLFSGSSPS